MKTNVVKWLLILLSLFLMLTLAVACKKDPGENTPCTAHTDATGDGKCDVCGKLMETDEICTDHIDIDGDNKCEICGATVAEEIPYQITVKDQDGNPLSNITVSLMQNGNMIKSGVTGENGILVGTILPGNYLILMEGFGDGWLPEGNGSTIEISAEKGSYEFSALNNTPDGSEKKPFFLGEETVSVTFTAGQTLHYFGKGTGSYLVVRNDHVKLTYNDEEYFPKDGELRVLIRGTDDTNATTPFTLTNTADGENVIAADFIPLPGSSGDPYEAKLNEMISATVGTDESVYYDWTATADGYLVLRCDTPSNYIMMYNITSMVVTGYTDGGNLLYLAVREGDYISIPVASRAGEAENKVEFTLTLLAGTSADPLPLSHNNTLRLLRGSEVTFVYHGEEKALNIPAIGLSLKNGSGNPVNPQGGYFRFTVADGDVLTLTNTTTGTLEVSFVFAEIES